MENRIQTDLIAKLEHELSMANDRINYLQSELDKYSSLKIHTKLYIKKNLRKLDSKIEGGLHRKVVFEPHKPNSLYGNLLEVAKNSDMLNLLKFNEYEKANKKLDLYRQSKYQVKRILKSMRRG
jgi:hypothetical protein